MMDGMSKRFRKWNGPIWNWSPSNVTLYIFVHLRTSLYIFVDLKSAELHALGNSFGQVSKISQFRGGTGGTGGSCILAGGSTGIKGKYREVMWRAKTKRESFDGFPRKFLICCGSRPHVMGRFGLAAGWCDVCCVGICVSCNLLQPHRDSGINHALVWGTRMMDFVICVDSKSSSSGSCYCHRSKKQPKTTPWTAPGIRNRWVDAVLFF